MEIETVSTPVSVVVTRSISESKSNQVSLSDYVLEMELEKENESESESVPHLIVDLFNLLAPINEKLSRKPEDFGWMDTFNGNIKHHQFTCDYDNIAFVLGEAKKFVDKVAPQNCQIDFVMKQFGSNALWNTFRSAFCSVFWASPSQHLYTFCVADAANAHDAECDDRLALGLALRYKLMGESVNVITNDKCRSLQQHWNFGSQYSISTNPETMIQPVYNSFYYPPSLCTVANSIPKITFGLGTTCKDANGHSEILIQPQAQFSF